MGTQGLGSVISNNYDNKAHRTMIGYNIKKIKTELADTVIEKQLKKKCKQNNINRQCLIYLLLLTYNTRKKGWFNLNNWSIRNILGKQHIRQTKLVCTIHCMYLAEGCRRRTSAQIWDLPEMPPRGQHGTESHTRWNIHRLPRSRSTYRLNFL